MKLGDVRDSWIVDVCVRVSITEKIGRIDDLQPSNSVTAQGRIPRERATANRLVGCCAYCCFDVEREGIRWK